MQSMLNGHDLSLCCGRTRFSFPDGEIIGDNTRLTKSLSYELFVRRIQKITFLKDLNQEDLLALLRIVALSPETIQKSGGVDKIMAEQGIRSIWVNEFDLSVIRGKRQEIESRGITPQGFDEADEGSSSVLDQNQFRSDEIPPEQLLPILLGRLSADLDDEIYIMLVRQAVSCCEAMKSRREPQALLPLLELLAGHTKDPARSEIICEFAHFAIEQISSGNEFVRFVLGRMEYADGLSKPALQAVISCGGPSAVVLALEQMALTNKVAVRKAISNLLAGLGEEAVPPLLNMLGDKRWFIVRNIAAILGSIASPEAVTKLADCLSHSDIRVCKEAARSLAKIGGREAEAALIRVLQQDNPALCPQVIASLGGMKSRKALAELIKIVGASDIFLKSLALKIDALSAIAMIGDRQVTSALAIQLSTHYLLASARGKQLKIAIVDCLGRLGDPQVLPVLKKMSYAQDDLGNACSEAIELIERSGSAKIGGS